MPGMYSVRLTDTVANSVSMGGVFAPGATVRRAGIKALTISFGTASDATIRVQGQRTTTAGTSTAVTPTSDDPADGVSNFVAGENHSAEPTYTSGQFLLDIGLYAKGFYREQLPLGDYYYIPATANNGIGFLTPSPAATPIIFIKLGVQQF
jgi:hypothetical protein